MDTPRSRNPIHPGPWDVVVIGAGAAGLMTCLELPPGLSVLLLNRTPDGAPPAAGPKGELRR